MKKQSWMEKPWTPATLDILFEPQRLRQLIAERTEALTQPDAGPSDVESGGTDGQFSNIHVDFPDEFATSSTSININPVGAEAMSRQGVRLQFYNDHVSIMMSDYLALAEILGCPRIEYHAPLGLTPVSEEQWKQAIQAVTRLANCGSEGTIFQPLFSLYSQWVTACFSLTQGHVSIAIEHVLLAGAAARELELMVFNRKDAVTRKKQKRQLSEQTSGRDEHNRAKSASALAWQSHAETILNSVVRDLTKSAKADYILANWEGIGSDEIPGRPSKKTIQNWLSKVSRARSSAGTLGG